MEYVVDYASEETKESCLRVIDKEINNIKSEKIRNTLLERIERIKAGERDLYF
jgi:2-iminoacetate synthase